MEGRQHSIWWYMTTDKTEICEHDVGVLGGARGMGYWIARFLQRSHYRPTLIDIDKKVEVIAKRAALPHAYVPNNDVSSLLDKDGRLPYDVLIIAVPLEAMTEAVATYGPLMKKDSLLMDIASIKTSIIDAMILNTNNAVHVLSVHPLFGPKFNSFEAQTCVLIQPTLKCSPYWRKWWTDLVKSEGGSVVHATAQEHDKSMMFIQVLTHFVILALGPTLLHDPNVSISKLINLRTPPFELILALVGRLYSGTPPLYWSIQRCETANDIRRLFVEAATKLSVTLAEGTLASFIDMYAHVVNRIGRTNLGTLQFNAEKLFGFVARSRKRLYAAKGTYACIENVESKAVHYGLIAEISPEYIAVHKSKTRVTIATRKAYLLTDEEFDNWARNHLRLQSSHIVLTCPSAVQSSALEFVLCSAKGVVDCTTVDVFDGLKVPPAHTKVTLVARTLPPPHCTDWKPIARTRLESFGCNVLKGL